MAELISPDVVIYVCHNSVPGGGRLPRQWDQDGAHVLVREVPCSGKMDAQYLLHTIEGGGRGICVVACPKGECRLAQGNYRAEIRIGTIRRLMAEIGVEPHRAKLVHCSPDETFERFDAAIREAVAEICALGESPIRTAVQETVGKT